MKYRSSGEMVDCIFNTYKTSLIPHGFIIYQTSYDMAMSEICKSTLIYLALPHWKYALHCCANFPRIDLTDQESG